MRPAPWSRDVLLQSMRRRGSSVRKLRDLLEGIQHRIAEAESIGWPALADSWREDEKRVQSAIDGLSLRRAA